MLFWTVQRVCDGAISGTTVLMESSGGVLRQVAKTRNDVQQGVTQLVDAKKLRKKRLSVLPF